MIVWRTYDQSRIDTMAQYAGVPVVNALTDQFHPCQTLADLLTIREHKGATAGLTLTFLGDAASNMSHSYLLSGALAGMHVRVSGPDGYRPDPAILGRAQEIAVGTGGSADLVVDAGDAARGADVLITDTWVSMGKEEEKADRARVFEPWQLDEKLVVLAVDPIVRHCLPAYRGMEITAGVLDGPRSVVWDEAENRRHAQKAILTWLVRS
jgi:ornithine carbamoyltransferase